VPQRQVVSLFSLSRKTSASFLSAWFLASRALTYMIYANGDAKRSGEE
jgi:hypothetical protein